ncbi:MAG: alcohol acetyltransferase, partial [Bacillota bacterium]
VELPPALLDVVERFDFLLCTARRNTVECAVASYQDQLSITFTRSIAEPYVERAFFRTLVQKGLHVRVESNQP